MAGGVFSVEIFQPPNEYSSTILTTRMGGRSATGVPEGYRLRDLRVHFLGQAEAEVCHVQPYSGPSGVPLFFLGHDIFLS